MSSEARPISPTKFATALQDLAIGLIYAKVSELANSIHHLKLSNAQLKEFADNGDQECTEALKDNNQVIQSMEHRILLCKYEVEQNRGLKWEGKNQTGSSTGDNNQHEGIFL